jgi:hypothetical protein
LMQCSMEQSRAFMRPQSNKNHQNHSTNLTSGLISL